MNGENSFKKVLFDTFYRDSKRIGFIDGYVMRDLVFPIWANVKEPTQKSKQVYKMYTPWPFFLEKEKSLELPTGFKTEKEYTLTSNKFICKKTETINNHIIIKITAKENMCISEGDYIVDLQLVGGAE